MRQEHRTMTGGQPSRAGAGGRARARQRWVAGALGLALLAAACGSGDGDTGGDASTVDGGTASTSASETGSESETTSSGTTSEAAAGGECSGTDEVRLQLKWVAQAQFAGYYAADEQGFYADQCLSVEILEGGPDVGPAQVVSGGGAEFGIDWVASTLAQRAAGEDFVRIAQVFERSGTLSVAWADSGISSFEDAAGKTVGAWGFGNEYEVLAGLKKAGLDPDSDVQLFDQPFDMNALLNREIDLAEAETYNEYAQLLEATNPDTGELYQPEDFTVIDMNDVGVAMLQDGIFVKQSYLEENRDIAVRFVRASLQGWIYCRDNPDDCVTTVFNRGSILGEGHQRWMMNEINRLVWPNSQGIGFMVPEDFDRTAQIATDYIDTITEQPGEDAYTNDIVEEAWEGIDDDLEGADYTPDEVEVTAGGE